MQNAVAELYKLGKMPQETDSVEKIQTFQDLIEEVKSPITDEEAKYLVNLFNDSQDDCYGLAWLIIHLIETAPSWPIEECLIQEGYWIDFLKHRAINAGWI
jgi:hypothetical protein